MTTDKENCAHAFFSMRLENEVNRALARAGVCIKLKKLCLEAYMKIHVHHRKACVHLIKHNQAAEELYLAFYSGGMIHTLTSRLGVCEVYSQTQN